MNRDDIIRMARDADLLVVTPIPDDSVFVADLARFAHLVYESVFRDANLAASRTILDAAVLEEREACATFLEHGVDLGGLDGHPGWQKYTADLLTGCAAAIRARKE